MVGITTRLLKKAAVLFYLAILFFSLMFNTFASQRLVLEERNEPFLLEKTRC